MLHFRNLRVWHATQDFIVDVYSATRTFPPDERFGLTSQLRRSAVSIAANIAESTGRFGPPDQTRLSQIALGSARETESHIAISRRLGFIDDEGARRLAARIDHVEGMLVRLIQRRRARRE